VQIAGTTTSALLMHVVLVAGTKPAGHEHPASRACAGVAIVQIAPTAIRVTIKVLNNFTIAPPRNDAVSPGSQDYLQSIIVTVTKILHHKTFSHKSVGAGDRSVPQPNRYRVWRVPMDGLRGLIVASIPRRKLNVPRSSFVQSRHVRGADPKTTPPTISWPKSTSKTKKRTRPVVLIRSVMA